MKDAEYIKVKCSDCVWAGPTRDLVKSDGLRYCPICGREFNVFPPRGPDKSKESRNA